MNNKVIEIFIVKISRGGRFSLSSIKAVEKEQTYSTDSETQADYFGWQYIGKRVRKDDNVFTNARDAAVYASSKLAERIDDLQEEINIDRNDLQKLYEMLDGKL